MLSEGLPFSSFHQGPRPGCLLAFLRSQVELCVFAVFHFEASYSLHKVIYEYTLRHLISINYLVQLALLSVSKFQISKGLELISSESGVCVCVCVSNLVYLEELTEKKTGEIYRDITLDHLLIHLPSDRNGQDCVRWKPELGASSGTPTSSSGTQMFSRPLSRSWIRSGAVGHRSEPVRAAVVPGSYCPYRAPTLLPVCPFRELSL